jgi:hypothetical protein
MTNVPVPAGSVMVPDAVADAFKIVLPLVDPENVSWSETTQLLNAVTSGKPMMV